MVLGDSLSLYTQASQRIRLYCTEAPNFFFFFLQTHQQMIYCSCASKLCDANNSWSAVPPRCAVSFHYCRLFIHHSHFTIISSRSCFSVRPLFTRFKVSLFVFFVFFFLSALRYISDLLVPNKEKLPRRKKQTVSSIFALLLGEWLRRCYGYSQGFLPRGGFERCLYHKRKLKK